MFAIPQLSPKYFIYKCQMSLFTWNSHSPWKRCFLNLPQGVCGIQMELPISQVGFKIASMVLTQCRILNVVGSVRIKKIKVDVPRTTWFQVLVVRTNL